MLRELKIRTTTETLASELARVCRTIGRNPAPTIPVTDAVAALLTNIGLYRCDYPVLGRSWAWPSDTPRRQTRVCRTARWWPPRWPTREGESAHACNSCAER